MTLTPADAGCRSVTEETVPQPDKTHTALGLCCENDNIFAAMSCKEKDKAITLIIKDLI
jgi:hypothetical protein